MEGRGGCCIARYVTGAYDMSKVNRIMLRFRPIAPKPVAGGTASDGSSSESSGAFSRCGRAKRKYAKGNNTNKRCNRRIQRRKTTPPPEQKDPVPMVTLPLLPETPDPKDSTASDLSEPATKNRNVPLFLSFENRSPEPYWYGGTADQAPVGLGGSLVTVECVTDTWEEGDGLGSTDKERRVKLSKDTCPGFISDGYGMVTWTNEAYREMMGCEGGVWLAMKVRAVVPYTSFTCRVRVQYACGKEKRSLTVPCDVWRMDSGGFAWRLDVKAALSLSLGW